MILSSSVSHFQENFGDNCLIPLWRHCYGDSFLRYGGSLLNPQIDAAVGSAPGRGRLDESRGGLGGVARAVRAG